MTNLTLYYPTFAEEDFPESVEFDSIADLKKDKTVKNRMFDLFGLRKTYAYDNLMPEFDSITNQYYKHIFHKSFGSYYGAAVIRAETESDMEKALKLLGTIAVSPDKW